MSAEKYKQIFLDYGNRALLSWLRRKGATSEDSLNLMVASKNHLCNAYWQICTDKDDPEPEASLELRDKLFEAWERDWEPMPQIEKDRHLRFVQRTGFAAPWMCKE